jgi:hypothetical protein
MALCIATGLLAAGVVVNAVRTVFIGELTLLLPLGVSFLFWYWISVGAYRRAIDPRRVG